jgi:hypothetical protein
VGIAGVVDGELAESRTTLFQYLADHSGQRCRPMIIVLLIHLFGDEELLGHAGLLMLI